ncbi:glycosyltransferase family 1 protein [Escherichia coli]|uniref:glycosyltransferase family 4 protein n=2 Tax=Escherichia coli TaxID=562 RepID=UPI0009C1D539|nr:glycosyltransferase family 4 protein [Escherichia coli]ARE47194.1 glycosyl transferase family 1 [Escherichia coli C]ATU34596.1 glycosyltransferase family 1 protein [Escherichia coli]EAB6126574.1 glycosyltransferase family 1 protein [Escherichia coli]EFC7315753.1 glycosyltransferase family 4 protein [Escherichia coli]EFG7390911.1 glycosyltransferase family 4 protein [Escherichia coli]
MKKIILSANTCWYLYNFRKNTIITLIQKGFDVYILAPVDEVYSKKLSNLGVSLLHISIDPTGVNCFKEFMTIIRSSRELSKIKPDYILNFTPKNNIYNSIAAWGKNIKVINNISGLGVGFEKKRILSLIIKYLYKISQRNVHFIFFQNEQDRSIFLSNKIVSVEKTKRIPGSGVDLARFHYDLKSPAETIVFILVARMLLQKGIMQYIEAACVLKNKYKNKIEFRLLGHIDDRNPSAISMNTIKMWHDKGIIRYLGTTDFVERELNQVDCVVLPSFYREGIPKSLLEAAAMGKPIIASDNIGCRDVVEDGINGFLCEPKNTKSLVDALERFINLSDKQKIEMGIASRRKIEQEFDEKKVIDSYMKLLYIE